MKKFLKWTGGVVLLAVVYIFGLWLWSNIPPKRPANVSRDAVFLFGVPLGAPFPIPKRGDWLNCWLDRAKNVNWCRVANVNGSLEYEGLFVRYKGAGPVSQDALQIDVKETDNNQEWAYFKGMSVPIVHLRDGSILIPAEAYEQGKQNLERVREHEKH